MRPAPWRGCGPGSVHRLERAMSRRCRRCPASACGRRAGAKARPRERFESPVVRAPGFRSSAARRCAPGDPRRRCEAKGRRWNAGRAAARLRKAGQRCARGCGRRRRACSFGPSLRSPGSTERTRARTPRPAAAASAGARRMAAALDPETACRRTAAQSPPAAVPPLAHPAAARLVPATAGAAARAQAAATPAARPVAHRLAGRPAPKVAAAPVEDAAPTAPGAPAPVAGRSAPARRVAQVARTDDTLPASGWSSGRPPERRPWRS